MKLFTETFKLYAYKQYDKCDLSIRVSDQFVMTFKLTHSEIKKLFYEYNIIEPENDRYGIQFRSNNGQHWFVMDKKHFQAVRITVGSNGVDYNFRVSYNEWNSLIEEYNKQMSSPQAWDEK